MRHHLVMITCQGGSLIVNPPEFSVQPGDEIVFMALGTSATLAALPGVARARKRSVQDFFTHGTRGAGRVRIRTDASPDPNNAHPYVLESDECSFSGPPNHGSFIVN